MTSEQVIRVSTSRGAATAVRLRYDFSPRERVFLVGAGELAPAGTLDLLSFESRLVFSATPGGTPIAEVDLSDAVDLMGGASLQIPTLAQFPAASRRGMRPRRETPFAIALRQVLERGMFRSGVVTLDVNGRPGVLTPFAELPPLADKSLARVALLITYPPQESDRGVEFDLRFIVQERRSHTNWRDDVSSATTASAEDHMARLLAELER